VQPLQARRLLNHHRLGNSSARSLHRLSSLASRVLSSASPLVARHPRFQLRQAHVRLRRATPPQPHQAPPLAPHALPLALQCPTEGPRLCAFRFRGKVLLQWEFLFKSVSSTASLVDSLQAGIRRFVYCHVLSCPALVWLVLFKLVFCAREKSPNPCGFRSGRTLEPCAPRTIFSSISVSLGAQEAAAGRGLAAVSKDRISGSHSQSMCSISTANLLRRRLRSNACIQLHRAAHFLHGLLGAAAARANRL